MITSFRYATTRITAISACSWSTMPFDGRFIIRRCNVILSIYSETLTLT